MWYVHIPLNIPELWLWYLHVPLNRPELRYVHIPENRAIALIWSVQVSWYVQSEQLETLEFLYVLFTKFFAALFKFLFKFEHNLSQRITKNYVFEVCVIQF